MARTSTTHDTFSAIGEPKRRELLERLSVQQMSVTELVNDTAWTQPTVSKHLRVLKEVNLVAETQVGRFRYYRINPDELRPIQEWIHQFEKYWGGTLDQLDSYLTDIQTQESHHDDQKH
ncbi:MAG: metalloregulator ArsR/SmtB family transcription factor [Gammaproteobacteria bacterium]|nr:metalloregulator ArsR/SmtB family transcription factor [Gammaproteobacteria bacterium]